MPKNIITDIKNKIVVEGRGGAVEGIPSTARGQQVTSWLDPSAMMNSYHSSPWHEH